MSWAYCDGCGKPTDREDYSAKDAERHYYECPKCQYLNPCDLTLAELIDDLIERVTELETKSNT